MDEALLIRERYKVIRVLGSGEDYACAEAVDILDREGRECLLNLYEGKLVKRYLQSFDSVTRCQDFVEMFSEAGTLVTVFRNPKGREIDEVFCAGDKHPWRDRLDYAGELMTLALGMADLPPEVSCAAMLSENVLVDVRDRRMRLRFKVTPMEDMTARELVYLTCDQLKKILRPRLGSPEAELRLLSELDRRVMPGIVQLYALWRERRGEIEDAYEALYKKGAIRRWFSLLWGRAKFILGGGRR